MDKIDEETEIEGTDTDAGADLDTDGAGAAGSAADELAGKTAAGDDSAGVDGAVSTEPKSLAEALSAGVDSVINKGKDKGKEAGSDAKDGEGDAAKKAADEKVAAGAEGKEGEGKGTGKDAKDGKQPDHVNDPIPTGVAERTRERITSLVDEVKQLREVAENNGAMIGAIMDSGATPDEFGAMVQYLHWTHSEDPKMLESAYTLLKSELEGVALRLGKPLPEVDWLTGHADLVDAVKNGLTTRDLAIEMAMGRAQTKRTQTQAAAKTAKADTSKQAETELATATADLDKLGTELEAADPLYKQKYAVLVPKLQAEFKKIPSSQWKGKFLEEYAKLRVAPKAAPPVIQNKPAKGQPLRPSAPSGDAKKAPGSALDALSSAIDGMRS
jgi:hypothetical protein